MKKVYFLSTCSTCQKIIKETGLEKKDSFFRILKQKTSARDSSTK
ncbi:MAG TPA: hypothetical protein VFC34_15565 [Puia sp.]|nr:hypothetical protein [Puia sp.]